MQTRKKWKSHKGSRKSKGLIACNCLCATLVTLNISALIVQSQLTAKKGPVNREMFNLEATGLGDVDDEKLVEEIGKRSVKYSDDLPIHLHRHRRRFGSQLGDDVGWGWSSHRTSKKADETFEPEHSPEINQLTNPRYTLLTTRKRPLESLEEIAEDGMDSSRAKNPLQELAEFVNRTSNGYDSLYDAIEDNSSNYLPRFARRNL